MLKVKKASTDNRSMIKNPLMKLLFLITLLSLSILVHAYEMDTFNLKDVNKAELTSKNYPQILYMLEQSERRKAQLPEMSFAEGLVFKRKISEYIAFVRLKRSDSPIPTFGDFNRDPLKYIREDHLLSKEVTINYYAANPSESFHHCKKTPLKQIVCPEGTYSFVESRVGSEVNDTHREPKDAPLPSALSPNSRAQANDQ